MAVNERDIRAYQDALQRKDRKVLDTLGARLINQNMGLVINTVEKFRNRFHLYAFNDARADLVQAGVIGLIRALAMYNPGRAAFSTIAMFKVLHEVQQEACKLQVTSHPKARQVEYRGSPEDFDRHMDARALLAFGDGADPADDLEIVAAWAGAQSDKVQMLISALLLGETQQAAQRMAKLSEKEVTAALGALRCELRA